MTDVALGQLNNLRAVDNGDGTYTLIAKVQLDATPTIDIGDVQIKEGGAVGEVQATPTANTLLSRLKQLHDDTTNLIKVPNKASFTRPNDTNAYAIGDLIANSTTAGSVTRLSWTGATISGNGGKGMISSFMLACSAAFVGTVRVHFLKTDHAVTNGDNGALVLTSLDLDNYIGSLDVSLDGAGNGGALGFASNIGLDYELATGDTVYAVLEARSAVTPVAQAVFSGKPKFKRFS